VVLQMVLRVWQVVPQMQKSRLSAGFTCLHSERCLWVGAPKDQKYRAGEEIRTLDVNLGKVALYH
jgi:hypothetical protein